MNLEESEALEGDIKPEEMLVALTNMNNGKSQGLEGFTTEFYNRFWSDLKYFGVRSFNQAYTRSYLSVSQRHWVITCLPKERKSKCYTKNWRPISLLNALERY